MPVSKAQQKAVTKYMKDNYDEIKVRTPKGDRDKWRAAAKADGKSLNQFIIDAVKAAMANQGEKAKPEA